MKVDYEELPAVFTIAGALAPDAPLVQDPSLRPDDPLANTNVLREHAIGWGDVDAATADLVVENTYRFPMVTHFAIEPHAFIAAPDGDGIAVWSSIQHPYWLQRVLARVLGLPLAKVRVHAPDPGGAFGGKQHAKYEPLLAFMALATGRPVRLVLTLEETFQAVRRGDARSRSAPASTSDGTFVFQDIDADYLIGAYADIADRVVGKGTYIGNGPYNWPGGADRRPQRPVAHRRHRPPSAASATRRSTGRSSRTSPRRRSSWASTRSSSACGTSPSTATLHPVRHARPTATGRRRVRRAAELIGWDRRSRKGRGRGIALGIKSGPTTGLSYSLVRLLADGSVVVYAGTQDMGQGARTIFAQIARRGAGRAARRGHGRHGRHGHRARTTSRPRPPLDGADGQRDPARLPRHPGEAAVDGARLESVDEADIVVERGEVRIGERACRSATC